LIFLYKYDNNDTLSDSSLDIISHLLKQIPSSLPLTTMLIVIIWYKGSMKSRGFTLIELLVVISIIALLSSVILAAVSLARTKGQIAAG